MGRLGWRTFATVALMPVAAWMGSVQVNDYLPEHGGVYFFVFLFLLGAALGYRAVLLVLIGVIAGFVRNKTQCESNEECVYGYLWFYLGPFMSIPVAVGATVGRVFASRYAKHS